MKSKLNLKQAKENKKSELSELDDRKPIEKMNETRNLFFGKINKTDKTFVSEVDQGKKRLKLLESE